MRRWRCSPSTRSTCSRCCRWASCGSPPPGCVRSTGLAQPLAEAFGLLDSLGNPVLWSLPLHWAGVHAGHPGQFTGGGRPARPGADGGRRPQRLRQGAGHRGPHLAAGAGQPRRRRRGHRRGAVVGPVRAHLGCHPAGRPGRAAHARRPGVGRHAAVGPRPQADDSGRRGTGRRARHRGRRTPRPGVTTGRPRGCPTANARSPSCLLLGMPYRDIGSQLFISAKTVEHHVARIRRGSGAESRSEMLSMLRAMLARPHADLRVRTAFDSGALSAGMSTMSRHRAQVTGQ